MMKTSAPSVFTGSTATSVLRPCISRPWRCSYTCAGWWPVNDGFAGDPAYFAVRWTAWIRAQGDTTLSMALGAKDDAWVLIDGEEVATIVGADEFVPELVEVPLDGGQYSIEVRYAHRTGDDSGMLFRVADGNVVICEPEFEE